jgi:G3E family GTPase
MIIHGAGYARISTALCLPRLTATGHFLVRFGTPKVQEVFMDLFPSRDAGRFGRRVKRERGARIPVTVVTGFLGAGKTTLLRRFLASPQGAGTAVIVNEFGAVGIDDALVRASADETVLLGNGCLCCIARSDLQLALRRLIFDRERGSVPPFARVVIETSGLADPGPILQTFSTDRALGGEFHVEVVLTVVDAVAGETNLDAAAEARKQAILADRLIISKTDLAEAIAVDRLTVRLRALNPRAAIELAVAGELDPQHMIVPAAVERSGFVAEAAHSDGIASFVVEIAEPVDWQTFSRAMETLTALRGADLLRVKGLLNIAGCRGPVVVQYVQHLAHPPMELQSWPDGKRTSRVVFVTRNIAENSVRDLFAAVQALAGPPAGN